MLKIKYHSGKLRRYMMHKNNFGGENYFSIVNNVDHTRKSAQLCISAHQLYRYTGLSPDLRV